MLDKLTMNARKPNQDEYGYKMLERMNNRHKPLAQWGFEHLSLEMSKNILDIGCGGGQNIFTMSHKAPNAIICGVDYSDASIKKSEELNKNEIARGTVKLKIGTAENLPYKPESFDTVTAFETVYYWNNITDCFKNVLNILQSGGSFFVCNEDSHTDGNEEIISALDMNIYTADEIKQFMANAGFVNIETYNNENDKWICVIGKKK